MSQIGYAARTSLCEGESLKLCNGRYSVRLSMNTQTVAVSTIARDDTRIV